MFEMASLHDGQQSLPSFDELPLVAGMPTGCTWGFWDRDGEPDELGTFNLITPKVVCEAIKEVREGVSVSLKCVALGPFPKGKIANPSQSFDDTVSFNTQAGSQWDGLRHVVHEGSQKLYNGVPKEQIAGGHTSTKLGIDRKFAVDTVMNLPAPVTIGLIYTDRGTGWHQRGGIVARGVLVDYVAYAQRHGISYRPTERHEITLDAIEQAAVEQGVEFHQGDILILRSGLIQWQADSANRSEAAVWARKPDKACIGVRASQDTVAWLWNHHFAAVAGDNIAWEAVPYPLDHPSLHQCLVPLFGMPIGELWNLEELALTCARLGRYSFLLTSMPLCIPGGVASPPNAIAIF
ncbi:hypothetical protein FE257_011347 [Aspergillus nanangensis]|uniref:Cyclase family protein n=1 Tax=Aspergillus nanangensis TaxID=2582783 RepID=A0AAD4CHH8_ASPNN|nr:hypothetical protein FE257_011347 [Aspergillus nanangensis]